MRKSKKNILAGLLMGLAVFLCGCSDKDGKLYTQKEVLKRVEAAVPEEKYELVSVDHNTSDRPRVDTYLFSSKERDLTFEVVSTLKQIYIDSPTGWYTKSVSIRYVDAVQEYYREEILKELEGWPTDDRGRLTCTSFDELRELAARIARVDQIYSGELEYNSKEWVKENPYASISVSYTDPEGKSTSFFGMDITGVQDPDFIYEYLVYTYAQAVHDGRFEDDTLPQAIRELARETTLDNVIVNSQNVSWLCKQQAEDDHLNNRTVDSFKAHYYYDWDSYVILLDCGLTDHEYAPQWLKAYSEVLGFDLKIEEDKGKVSWTYNGDDWLIEAKEDRQNHISSVVFKKNGKDQQISYITVNDDRSPVHASYIIGIRAEDFAEIFGLKYVVDQDNSSISFLGK